MIGWLVPEEGRGRLRVEQTRALGLPLMRITLPRGHSERQYMRRRIRAARLLWEQGVRRVLIPKNFGGWDVFARAGLSTVDPLPLYRALGARLALARLMQQGILTGQAKVLLRGRQVDRALFEAAHTLCPCVRTLVLIAGDSGTQLCRLLRKEYGAAVPETLGTMRPDVVADFTPIEPAVTGGLRLYGPLPHLEGLTVRVPGVELPGVEAEALITLLWEEGRIELKTVEICSTPAGEISLTEG